MFKAWGVQEGQTLMSGKAKDSRASMTRAPIVGADGVSKMTKIVLAAHKCTIERNFSKKPCNDLWCVVD